MFAQTTRFKSSMMRSAQVSTSATCAPTPAFPWCTSLTATVPPWNSCKPRSASCRCEPTTSPPWVSLQKRWHRKYANTSRTSRSPTRQILSDRPLVRPTRASSHVERSLFRFPYWLSYVRHFVLQQTAGRWGLTTPTLGETGDGSQRLGWKSWLQTCYSPFESRGPTRVCQSASPTVLQKDQHHTSDFSNNTLYFHI